VRWRRAGGFPASCRPTPRRHGALIPSHVSPGTRRWGRGCVPPWQSHQTPPTDPAAAAGQDAVPTACRHGPGREQGGSGEGSSPVAPGDCPGRRKRPALGEATSRLRQSRSGNRKGGSEGDAAPFATLASARPVNDTPQRSAGQETSAGMGQTP